MSRSEQERLRSAATQQNDLPALLSLYTGMRLGEVCALKWSDIDWEKKTVTVRRTAQRTASVENRDGKRALLGHQSAKTTLDFYGHSLSERQRYAASLIASC